ncbi:wings apart-like protein regulation of heterochromatin-domain-containing protein [Xylaria arbuscula]|nr:wings apart-like protein regulation of heterochromatin-domain-containing protein [Xylaria arbuscula]
MGAEFERGAMRKKRGVTTYGKAGRKRQPKTVFTPVTASDSMSDEDPIVAPDRTTENRQPPVVPSPKPKAPPARSKDLDGTRDKRPAVASSQNIAGTDRKRKISQIYKSKGQSQHTADESEKEDPLSAPEPRRSRISQPENRPTANGEGARTQRTAPSQSLSREAREPRLSSPPPTPTPPRVSKPVAKSPFHVSRQRLTNEPPTKTAQKQPVQRQHQIPLHLARDPTRRNKQPNTLSTKESKEQSRQTHIDILRGPSSAKKPRKRLIDALAEQESSDATELEEEIAETQAISSQNMPSQSSNASDFDDSSLLETPKPTTRVAPSTGTRTFTRSSSALKFTYGQGRKVIEEEDDLLESLALPSDSSYTRRRLDLGGPKKSTSAMREFDFDDVDGAASNSPSSKLRGIHELRQAGANSRVADAMQDLIDQMGKPGANVSSRRAALLQVAEKMRDKSFVRQCRDHGVESVMLKDIGKETDIICAYLILSSLVMIMAKGPSAHVGSLLRTEEAGPIFARLLGIGDDIKKVVKDRKTNLSKRSQNSVVNIENLLQKLSIWDGDRPSFVSPRNLAIKCLQLLIAQDVLIARDQRIFTQAVTEHLFEVLSDARDSTEYWDYPQTARSIELCGALSVLDVHAVSVTATQSGHSEWAVPYLPIIADSFYTSLQTASQDGKALEDLMLKLTINVTNNNLAAPDVFASKGLLPALTASISSNFNQALTLIAQDTWADGILDSLVLRLGILINFAEHSELVRQIVNDCRYGNVEPARELIRLFIENHRRTGEADSMEKTHLNVAFGYLSVLLGYLTLHRPARQKLVSSHSAKSIGPLIGSIREFIAHYEQVENAMSESDNDDHHQGGYTGRLQELVQQLEAHAARD